MTDTTTPTYFAIMTNEEPETYLFEVHELIVEDDEVPADEANALAEQLSLDLMTVATTEELKAISDSIIFPPDPTNHWWAFNETSQRFVSVGDHEDMNEDLMSDLRRQARRDHNDGTGQPVIHSPIHAMDALQLKCAIQSGLSVREEE